MSTFIIFENANKSNQKNPRDTISKGNGNLKEQQSTAKINSRKEARRAM